MENNTGYDKEILESKNIADIFDIVKDVVYRFLGKDQAGLMVGIADLGLLNNGFVGAFYSLEANTIIINKRPLARILHRNQDLYKYYLFHIMLHEYVHAIGSYDEAQTRQIVYAISSELFGDNHVLTELAKGLEKLMPAIIPNKAEIPKDLNIEFVKGIDRKNINYIN